MENEYNKKYKKMNNMENRAQKQINIQTS